MHGSDAISCLIPQAFFRLNVKRCVFPGSNKNAKQAQLYSPDSNTWKSLPDMLNNEGTPSLVLLGARVFVVGGLTK